jgi:hypothetical protein
LISSESELDSDSDSSSNAKKKRGKRKKKSKKQKKGKHKKITIKKEKDEESAESEEYDLITVKGQQRLADEINEIIDKEMKNKKMDKSDGLKEAVLNYGKHRFPKLQQKARGKASESRSNQKASLIGNKIVTNDEGPLNMASVWETLEESQDKNEFSMKERVVAFVNYGLFKEGTRKVNRNSIKVVTQDFKENKVCNQELLEKNFVCWAKKYYILTLNMTYILYKESIEGLLRTEMALLMRHEAKGLTKATNINAAVWTPDLV